MGKHGRETSATLAPIACATAMQSMMVSGLSLLTKYGLPSNRCSSIIAALVPCGVSCARSARSSRSSSSVPHPVHQRCCVDDLPVLLVHDYGYSSLCCVAGMPSSRDRASICASLLWARFSAKTAPLGFTTQYRPSRSVLMLLAALRWLIAPSSSRRHPFAESRRRSGRCLPTGASSSLGTQR